MNQTTTVTNFSNRFLACFKLTLTCFVLFVLYNCATIGHAKPEIHSYVVLSLILGTIIIGILRSNAVVRAELLSQQKSRWKYLTLFVPLWNVVYLFKLSEQDNKPLFSILTSLVGLVMYSVATFLFGLFFLIVMFGTTKNAMMLF